MSPRYRELINLSINLILPLSSNERVSDFQEKMAGEIISAKIVSIAFNKLW